MLFRRLGVRPGVEVASFDWVDAGPGLVLLRLELGSPLDADRADPRLRILRTDGATDQIEPLPGAAPPGGAVKLAFGAQADVIDDPGTSFTLVAGELSAPLPRPGRARARRKTPAPREEQGGEALSRELEETRERLKAAEERADDAFWHQVTAEDRAATARLEARSNVRRIEQLEAALAQVRGQDFSLEHELEAARELMADKDEEIAALSEQVATGEAEGARLRAELNQAQARSTQFTGLQAAAEARVTELEEDLRAAESRYEALRADHERLEMEIDRDEVGRLQAELELVQASATHIEAELQRLLAAVADTAHRNGS
jgi:hypothetical protein